MDVGVLCFDGVLEGREAVVNVRLEAGRTASKPVLISDLDVVEFPGLGMPERGTESAIGRRDVAADEFDLGQGVVDPNANLGFRNKLTVKRKAGVYTEN